MNGYEKMIKIMREEGQKKSSSSICLGEMIAPQKCKIGSLELDEDDLLCASNLKGKLVKGDDVVVQRLDEETYVILAKVVSL